MFVDLRVNVASPAEVESACGVTRGYQFITVTLRRSSQLWNPEAERTPPLPMLQVVTKLDEIFLKHPRKVPLSGITGRRSQAKNECQAFNMKQRHMSKEKHYGSRYQY